jgi:S1-C subfamily serine protease
MQTAKRRTVTFLLAMAAGTVGGLVLSGRLALTTPSTAAPADEVQRAVPAPPPAAAATQTPGGLPDLSSVAERALHVSANITSTTTVELDPFWQRWYGARSLSTPPSLGSGVVVTSDGYILTNTHVIGDQRASIRVSLEDGRERPARLIGIDEISDLAVVKIDATGLETIPWGDSDRLRVAEWVMAVGNPFQLSGTVTLGIVSKVTRSGDQVGSFQDFIQTDAAINRGNSGGALINARGELIGINTMIYSESGGNLGIGFAIPSNAARQIMTALIRDGRVTYGWIGDNDYVTITPALAARYGLPTGVYVRGVERNSPSHRGGLPAGSTIVTVNGQDVTTREQIDRIVGRMSVGSRVRLEFVDETGRKSSVEVPVGTRPVRQATPGRRSM